MPRIRTKLFCSVDIKKAFIFNLMCALSSSSHLCFRLFYASQSKKHNYLSSAAAGILFVFNLLISSPPPPPTPSPLLHPLILPHPLGKAQGPLSNSGCLHAVTRCYMSTDIDTDIDLRSGLPPSPPPAPSPVIHPSLVILFAKRNDP